MMQFGLSNQLKAWIDQKTNFPRARRKSVLALGLKLQHQLFPWSLVCWSTLKILDLTASMILWVNSYKHFSVYTHTSCWFCFFGECWVIQKGNLNNREKNYTETKIRVTSDFSLETMQGKRQCNAFLNYERGKNYQPISNGNVSQKESKNKDFFICKSSESIYC